MPYRVRWKKSASRALERLWLTGEDPDGLLTALGQLERLLRSGPEAASESRPDGQRVVFALPLAARVMIDEEAAKVVVVAVWRVRKR